MKNAELFDLADGLLEFYTPDTSIHKVLSQLIPVARHQAARIEELEATIADAMAATE